jgi:hypothetical protein
MDGGDVEESSGAAKFKRWRESNLARAKRISRESSAGWRARNLELVRERNRIYKERWKAKKLAEGKTLYAESEARRYAKSQEHLQAVARKAKRRLRRDWSSAEWAAIRRLDNALRAMADHDEWVESLDVDAE